MKTTKSEASERVARLDALKHEAELLREWSASGRQGDKPATPLIDEARHEHELITQILLAEPKARAKRAAVAVQFFHDGRPLPASQNKLSTVAYDYTKGIKADSPRLTTNELRVLLAERGIDDPNEPGWECMLPNGIVLSTIPLGVIRVDPDVDLSDADTSLAAVTTPARDDAFTVVDELVATVDDAGAVQLTSREALAELSRAELIELLHEDSGTDVSKLKKRSQAELIKMAQRAHDAITARIAS